MRAISFAAPVSPPAWGGAGELFESLLRYRRLGYIHGVSVPPQTDTARNGSMAAPLPYGPQGRSPWLDVDWREHQRWVPVDGRPVNVIELGAERSQASQTLVFIHGLSRSAPNWLAPLPA